MKIMTVLLWLLWFLGGFVVVATIVPMLRLGYWQVRVFDFPRMQLCLLALGVIAAVLAVAVKQGWRVEHAALLALVTIAGLWQAYRVAPYTSVWKREVEAAKGSVGSLMVCNLDKRNRRHDEVSALLEDVSPDVLILIELDKHWADGLGRIRETYSHRVEEILPDGLGLAVWSRFPIGDSDVRTLVSDRRPSILAEIETPGGETVRLVAIHPTPPGLAVDGDLTERYDSRIRDAELMLIAREVEADPDHHWIVAGDFNDVAWSHTTQLFRRVSGLADPRIGRGLLNTYHARYWFARYPLDHVFVSSAFRVGRFDRVRTPGSDHFAVVVELDLEAEDTSPPAPEASETDRDESADLIEEGVEDAIEQGE